MSDEYLWDRSGPPDPEIERLERVLATLRHEDDRRLWNVDRGRNRSPKRWIAMAAAAVVLMTVAAWALMRTAGRESPWQVVAVKGTAAVRPSTKLRTGQMLLTDASASVTLEAGEIGRIDVAPGSELRVIESSAGRHTLSLPHGTIHALIWAPPRQFVVDTPSARAIDLGCQYTLAVDAGGNGVLTVETGWVAFQFDGRESFIPAGAECHTNRSKGPGTPYYQDASETLRRSVTEFDATGDVDALRRVLSEARPRDGLTLWHLLTRAPASEREPVFDRFAALVKLPPEVTREGALGKDPHTLDLCWNALNLENAGWWREWKRDWRP